MSEIFGDCENCGYWRGFGTGRYADEVGYRCLCRRCARDLVPDRWETTEVPA